MDALHITCTSNGEALHVTVTGELDLATSPALEAAMREGADQHDRVVIDLTGVDFMDSTGVKALLSARLDGIDVVVASASPPVRRVLELAGVEHLLDLSSQASTGN